ncbi:hypothetical protein [Tropicibacter sp. S64]|uniref:hypothetical protein n=1 Tax=Tropicibacter sp. S64 TaxID=3415122 RepID=UPI003C7C23A8
MLSKVDRFNQTGIEQFGQEAWRVEARNSLYGPKAGWLQQGQFLIIPDTRTKRVG